MPSSAHSVGRAHASISRSVEYSDFRLARNGIRIIAVGANSGGSMVRLLTGRDIRSLLGHALHGGLPCLAARFRGGICFNQYRMAGHPHVTDRTQPQSYPDLCTWQN